MVWSGVEYACNIDILAFSSGFFDTRLKILTLALQVVQLTNMRHEQTIKLLRNFFFTPFPKLSCNKQSNYHCNALGIEFLQKGWIFNTSSFLCELTVAEQMPKKSGVSSDLVL